MFRFLAQELLRLFTARSRAESIVGDLTEEARSRGAHWFWSELLGAAAALCWKSLRSGPWRFLARGILGLVVWQGVYFILLAGSGVLGYLRFFGPGGLASSFATAPFGFWILVALDIGAANLLVGAVFGRWASRREENGVAPLFVLWLVAWASWPFLAHSLYGLAWQWNVAIGLAFPLVYLTPLLVGGVLGRRYAPTQAEAGGPT